MSDKRLSLTIVDSFVLKLLPHESNILSLVGEWIFERPAELACVVSHLRSVLVAWVPFTGLKVLFTVG